MKNFTLMAIAVCGLSDNVTFFVEQVEAFPASPYHYRVVFKPASLVPAIEVRK
jgi:hypothetical protein